MKRVSIVIGLILASISGVFAQQLSARLDVGGSMVTNSWHQDYVQYWYTSPKFSYNAGIGLTVPFNQNIQFSSDLLVSNINSALHAHGSISDSIQHRYLVLPDGPFVETNMYYFFYLASQNYLSWGHKNSRLNVLTGYRIGALGIFHGNYSISHIDGGYTSRKRLGDRRKLLDFGAIVGFKLNINSKTGLLCTYYHGFTDITKNYPAPRSNSDFHVRQLTVGVSYLLKDHSNQPMRTKEKLT